jgi:vitamin B12/bleomycin/antimicrobial peptide transport system ATP-binding/permease protein
VSGSVDWGSEWLASLVWILAVTVAAALGSALIGALLMRSTVWGRQFRRLALPYFRPTRDPRSWGPLVTALLVLLMTISAVRLQVLLSYWSNGLFTALQELDSAAFFRLCGVFGVLATIWVARGLFDFYVQQKLIIQWRVWLNEHMVADWLEGNAFDRGRFTPSRVDNPDQRIQEDVASFTSTSASLAIGAISSLVSLVSFTLILWQLSGPLPIFGVEIPRAMVFTCYIYVIIATVIAFRIGRPLIRLNFRNERLTGSFRYALVRLRDNSENVAFYRGAAVERRGLTARFAAVIENTWNIVFRSLKFQGWNLIVTQAAELVPYLIQAPRFFAGTITLGDVQQTGAAFDQVQGSLSFFRLAYDDFAAYRAVLNRLTGLLDSDAEARKLPSVDIEDGDGLEVRDLTVRRPDEGLLISDLDLSLATGDTLLIKGPSGSGKTTLLRSLADLWPYAEGQVRRPLGAGSLFLSQQPYVPLGSLRTALAYPEDPDGVDDERAREVLRKVQLPHLAEQLDEEVDWARRLSPGEQQRLGFARILISRPRVAFLDEATSAVDEGIEHALYDLVRAELPETILVSVGHRSTLGDFHAGQLELLGEGRWAASGVGSLHR